MRSWFWFVVSVLAVFLAVPSFAQAWTAEYAADATPDAGDPAWHTSLHEGASMTAEEGVLRIVSAPQGPGGVFMAIGANTPDQYLKEASWGDAARWDASKPTTLEFRMRIVETFADCPLVCQVQLSDGAYYHYLHFSPKGVCSSDGAVRHAIDTTQFHVYRITLKKNVPNLYVDDALSPTVCFESGFSSRNALIIGDVSSAAAGASEWDYVRWTNEEATPWEEVEVSGLAKVDKGTVWVDPRFTEIETGVDYPCWGGHNPVKLNDGRIMLVYWGPVGTNYPVGRHRIFCRVSDDRGKTWGPERVVSHHSECRAVGSSALVCADGTVRAFYMGFYQSVWKDGEPDMELTRSDLWAIESHDNGETWINKRMAFRGYTGATNGAIETSSGHIVVPFSYDVTNPGRLVSACAVSGDKGRTWQVGEAIDFGGHGDHAGALEPAVIELKDGRLWLLIRTTRGQFWQAFSSDNGLTWGEATPTAIKSPSSPCHITRLASGRLALVWNNTMDTTKGRDALSLAFSEDDGKVWSDPIVCAKAKQVSYPHVFEPDPGILWVCMHNVNAGFHNLAYVILEGREDELLGK